MLVGVRPPLVAFNVNLRNEDPGPAREIAALVRESGGGFPGLRALGLALAARRALPGEHERDRPGRPRRSHEIVAAIEAEASARGIEVAGSELVGLIPAGAALCAAGAALRLEALDAGKILELRLLEKA